MTRMHLHKLFGMTVLALALAWMTDRAWSVPALDEPWWPHLQQPTGTGMKEPSRQPPPLEEPARKPWSVPATA